MNVVIALVCLVIAFTADWGLGSHQEFPWTSCLAGVIAAVGGPLLVYCVAFLVFRFRAPFRLDEQRVAEIRDASNALIEARDKHARELDTLRESYRVAFKAKEDEEISRLANEKGAAIEEEKARNEAPRYVQRAIGALFAAYRELEIVSNRADDNAWGIFSQRLEEYKAAYALLPLVARRFHERAEPALSRFVRFREFDRLLASMSDARDIMLNGECEMDLTVSPNPVVVISSEACGLKPTRGQKYRRDTMRCWG
jgi:hypothetical protein